MGGGGGGGAVVEEVLPDDTGSAAGVEGGVRGVVTVVRTGAADCAARDGGASEISDWASLKRGGGRQVVPERWVFLTE